MYNVNDNSYNIALDALTGLDHKYVEQTFFKIDIPTYIDIDAGNNPFKSSIINYIKFDKAGDGFEGFNVDTDTKSRLAEANVGYDKETFYRHFWAKAVEYTIPELREMQAAMEMASKLGYKPRFDLIEDKLSARKRNYDQTLQFIAFLGNRAFSDTPGLLSMGANSVNVDNTTLVGKLSTLTDAQLSQIAGQMMQAYLNNNEYTMTRPNQLIIPTDDKLALTQVNSVNFPAISKFKLLENMFKDASGNPDFKIVDCAFAQQSFNNANGYSINADIYLLYNKDPNSAVFDIPVEYTTTEFTPTENKLCFSNAAYSYVGGVRIMKPQEFLYFTY